MNPRSQIRAAIVKLIQETPLIAEKQIKVINSASASLSETERAIILVDCVSDIINLEQNGVHRPQLRTANFVIQLLLLSNGMDHEGATLTELDALTYAIEQAFYQHNTLDGPANSLRLAGTQLSSTQQDSSLVRSASLNYLVEYYNLFADRTFDGM